MRRGPTSDSAITADGGAGRAKPRSSRPAALLALGALLLLGLALAPAAHAEVKTLLSGPQNSLCVNPTEPQFQSVINGKPNYEGDKISHSGPFADTGSSCSSAFGEKAVQVGGPGEPADGTGGWEEGIPEADWVGPYAGGNDTGNVATSTDPKYYIYDEEVSVCANQLAGAKLTGEWMADNEAGAFINGFLLGNNPNMGNWNGPYATFSTTHLQPGVNTLQFVVINEGSITGVDFRVHLETTVPCREGPATAAHWLSDGQPIAEGKVEPVKTKGTLSFRYAETTITCKLKDAETIVNPVGGGNGTDEMTAFTLSGCKAKPSPCPKSTKLEVVAAGLPWKTELTLGPPIEDKILGMIIAIKCSGTVIHEFGGSLGTGVGNSTLEFSTGALSEPAGLQLFVSGSDAMTGPKGDLSITAAEEPAGPPPPRWYSNGELIPVDQVEPVASSGTLTLGNREVPTTCKLKDEETIVNPGGSGTDEITTFSLTGCKSAHSPCKGSAREELVAVNLPWKTRLIAGPPIRDVIEGIDIEVRCNGASLGSITGTLEPVVGESVLEFNESSGSLTGPAKEVIPVSGSDQLTGPKGDQKITAH